MSLRGRPFGDVGPTGNTILGTSYNNATGTRTPSVTLPIFSPAASSTTIVDIWAGGNTDEAVQPTMSFGGTVVVTGAAAPAGNSKWTGHVQAMFLSGTTWNIFGTIWMTDAAVQVLCDVTVSADPTATIAVSADAGAAGVVNQLWANKISS